MKLQNRIGQLSDTNTMAIAISQEDTSLENFGKFQKSGFDPAPRFEIVADLNRAATQRYDRTSVYLIDTEGIVREIFPMLIHYRANWDGIIDEIARL